MISALPRPELRRARLTVAGAFFVQGLTAGALLTRLPALRERYALGTAALTILIAAVAAAAGLGSLVAATVIRRIGSAAALRAGLTGVVVAVIVIALAGTRAGAFTGLGLYGFAVGTVDATMNVRGVAVQGQYGRSIMTSFHGSFSVGAAVGALCSAATAGIGWPLGQSLLAVGAIAAALVALIAPFPLSDLAPAGSSLAAGGERGSVLRIGVVAASFFAVDSATANWAALYVTDGLHATQSTAALGFAGYQATTLLVRLVGDRVVQRRGAMLTVRFGALIGTLGLAAVVTAPAAPIALAGFAVLGLGLSVVPPLSLSAAGYLDERSGIARVNAAGYIGFVGGGVLVGTIAAVSTMRLGFLLPLLLAILIVLLSGAFAAASPARQ